jgi:hypothetical protein
MKPFTRLSESDVTDAERLMLESAKDDAPSPGAKLHTLAALGLTAGAVTASAGTAHAASTLIGGSGAKAASSVSVLLKWIALGAVAGTVTTASVALVSTADIFGGAAPAGSTPSAPPPRAATTSPAVPRPLTQPPQPAPEPPAAAIEPAPKVESSVSRPHATMAEDSVVDRASPPREGAFPTAGDTVAEEVAALDRARSALAGGDPRTALGRVDAYERSYPHGTLAPEAMVLRVRSLVQLGRQREAQVLVEGYVRAHPGSAQAARLRALVGDPGQHK